MNEARLQDQARRVQPGHLGREAALPHRLLVAVRAGSEVAPSTSGRGAARNAMPSASSAQVIGSSRKAA